MVAAAPPIRSLKARTVVVPMARPLQVSSGAVTVVPLVLIDMETDGGPVGHSYIFCYAPMLLAPMASLLDELAASLVGEAVEPLALASRLRGLFFLPGRQGLATMAVAGIEMAAWDVFAKVAGLPLARALGGSLAPVPAYNSNGLGLIGAERAGAEAKELVAGGFRAVKVRLGYPDVETDVAVVRAVRSAVGADVDLMSDYNQVLGVAEAQVRIRVLDDEGLYWVEEPTRCDDDVGNARIRENIRTPLQLGENCWGPNDVAKALDAGACDYIMPDVMKMGGIAPWLEAAAMADPLGMPVSSHLFPEVSAHLLALAPTAHWLEYVDWANPILARPLVVEDGNAVPSAAPGIGIEWNEDAVAEYRV